MSATHGKSFSYELGNDEIEGYRHTATAHKESKLPAFRAQGLARYLGSRRLPPRQPGQTVVVTRAVVEELMIAGRRQDSLPSVLLTVSEFVFEATDISEVGLNATLQKTHRDTGRVPSASEANVVLPLLQVSHVLVDQVYTRVLVLISAESAATLYSTSHCHLYLFPSAHEAKRFSQDVGTAFSKLTSHVVSSPVTPSPAPSPRLIASSSSTRNTSKVGHSVGTSPISLLHAYTNLPPHLPSVVVQSIPLPPTPPEQLQMQRGIQQRLQAVRGEPSARSSSDGSVADILCGVQHSGPLTNLSQLSLSDNASSGYGTTESTPWSTKALVFNDSAGASCNAGNTDAENSSVPSTHPPSLPPRPPPSYKHPY